MTGEAASRLTAALADRYRLERELGQGGMATVYLAEDLKHKRKVALKVLRPELAAVLGAERFVQEITTTAALQHPHILPLFDSGTVDGFLYYVMPFIDGETLRARLDRETQLGIDEAVKLTIAVADALDYAHRHGVIHRDIKPENILLHDGRPMVADFGIALALSAAAGGRMTETGLSLGTPHYMSPEQATAEKEITARSDIYSLGSVLYEMLTGQPPHLGGSAQQIIMKIIAEDAQPVTRLRKAVPPNVAAAVAKSIEKLPADRFESAKAFAEALVNPAFATTVAGRTASPTALPPYRLTALLAGIAILAPALAAWGWLRPVGRASREITRLAIALPRGEEYRDVISNTLAVAPDGRSFVYSVGESGTNFRLWLRRLDQLHGSPIPGTERAIEPFFSPDGMSLGFTAGTTRGELTAVSLAGGPPVILVRDSAATTGATWGDDGFVYFAGVHDLRRVPEAGGKVEVVATPDTARGERNFAHPEILPGSKVLLFVALNNEGGVVKALRLATGEVRAIGSGTVARGLPGGYLAIVGSDGKVTVSRFDQTRLTLSGPPKPVLDSVQMFPFNNGPVLAVSAAGTLLYSEFRVRLGIPVWVDRTGETREVEPGWRGGFANPALSPDGSRLALSQRSAAGQDIWIKHIGGPLSRLTLDGHDNSRPAWSPDGRTVLFTSEKAGLFEQPADGRAPSVPLQTGRGIGYEGLWSADGRWMIYRVGGGGAEGRDIYARRLGSDSARIPLVTSPAEEYSPALSPDGRLLAYVSDESGRTEVYVRPFPSVNEAKWQVSSTGGTEPLWAHSSRELFYRSGAHQLMAATILPGGMRPVGAQRPLFDDSQFAAEGIHTDYAISPDDRRFLMIREELEPSRTIVLVLNWFEDIRLQMEPAR